MPVRSTFLLLGPVFKIPSRTLTIRTLRRQTLWKKYLKHLNRKIFILLRSIERIKNLKQQVLTLHDEVADVKMEIDSSRKPTDELETYL